MKTIRFKSIGLAIAIVVTLSLFEQLITGDGVEWFLSLDKPSFLVSMNVFYAIATLLAIFCVTVLSRLLIKYFSKKDKLVRNGIIWIILILFFNGLWNYFFMGLQSTRNGFIGMLLFLPLVLLSMINLWKVDKLSFGLISLYAVWVVYDICWAYALWQME